MRYRVIADKMTPDQLQDKLNDLGRRYNVISVSTMWVTLVNGVGPNVQAVIVVEDPSG